MSMRILPGDRALSRALLVGLAAVCVSLRPSGLRAQAHTTLASISASDTTATTLAPGDILKIAVFRSAELSCECVVGSDGSIVHPLYRELKVAGIPIPTVESRIRAFLSQYETNPMVVVSPLVRVFVGGEVRQPNVYNVPPGTTLAQIIGLAGGPTDRAELEKVQLLRSREHLTLNLLGADGSAAQTPVHSGDQILVSRSRSVFQDFVAPMSSLIAAAAAVTTMIVQLRR